MLAPVCRLPPVVGTQLPVLKLSHEYPSQVVVSSLVHPVLSVHVLVFSLPIHTPQSGQVQSSLHPQFGSTVSGCPEYCDTHSRSHSLAMPSPVKSIGLAVPIDAATATVSMLLIILALSALLTLVQVSQSFKLQHIPHPTFAPLVEASGSQQFPMFEQSGRVAPQSSGHVPSDAPHS